jgi:hypothetical protein
MREQLKARTAELDKLRAEKTKLETELASARKAASVAASTAASAAAATQPAAHGPAASASDPPSGSLSSGGPVGDAVDTAPPPSPPMFESDQTVPSRPSWIATIVVSVLTLIAGFVLGWRVLDKRIRAKYGGLRIY